MLKISSKSVRLESRRSTDEPIGMISIKGGFPILPSVCKERLIILTDCVLRSVADRINLRLYPAPPAHPATAFCGQRVSADVLWRYFTLSCVYISINCSPGFCCVDSQGTKHDTVLGLNSGNSACLNIL